MHETLQKDAKILFENILRNKRFF